MLRKALKIALIMGIQIILIGAGIFTIILRNVDSENNRLVRIDALIGGEGRPDPSKIPNTQEQQEKKDDNNDKKDIEQNTKNLSITIRISGTQIYINGSPVVGAPFEAQFLDYYDGSQGVILQDDYADYQTYLGVLNYLKDKSINPEERKL